MASIDNKELEKKLVEAGNKLLQLPSSVDDILVLLDEVENCLSRVEQSPSQSMQIALSPSVKALIADDLLRHRDTDVKVAVASCISEITRITAPDAPYDDDQMKDIFQLIVSSFENLSDMASRSYDKRTLILETVAKVRSCVVMLDLECDGLIVEMFQYFLKAIRDDHPDNVFSYMETIMTLVLEESEGISLELVSPILASVKIDNQEVPTIARKLAESVVKNSATKLKPYLIQATKALGFSLDDYGKAISSLFSETTGAGGRNDRSACVEQSTEDSNLAKASSDVAVQDENKLAVASPHEAAQDQSTKDSLPDAHAEGDHSADDRFLKSVVSNGVKEAGYVDRTADRESSKEQKLEQEQAQQTDQPVDANVTINGELADSNTGRIIKSDSKTDERPKKRRRKKSVNNSTERHASSRVDNDKEAKTTAHHGKSLSKEVHSSPSVEEPSVEVPVPREAEQKDVHKLSPKELGSKEMNAASPSSSGNLLAEGRCKKVGRAKKSDDLTRGVATSADVSKKASDGTGGLEGKQKRRSGKKLTAGHTNEEKTLSLEDKSKKRSRRKATAEHTTDVKTPALADKSKSEDGSTSDSENKPLKLCVRKLDARENIGDGPSSKNKEDRKRRIRGKSILKSNSIQPTKDDEKEMVSSPKPALNLAKVEYHLEDTPKTSSKRKRVPVKEKASDTLEYGDSLIGLKVKVWWPDDQEFYQGAIVSFDGIQKHKVVYTDGDEEVLNLKEEKWEIVGADSVLDVEQATEYRSPDPSNEMKKKKRAKTNSEQGKTEEGSRVEASSNKSKPASTKSGRKSRVDVKCTDDDTSKSGDKTDASGDCTKKRSHKSIADVSTADEKSNDVLAPKSVLKMKLSGTQKTNTEDTPKTARKGKATKSSRNSDGSGNVKEEILVKEERSPEMVESTEEGMPSKVQQIGTKDGKKRRKGAAAKVH